MVDYRFLNPLALQRLCDSRNIKNNDQEMPLVSRPSFAISSLVQVIRTMGKRHIIISRHTDWILKDGPLDIYVSFLSLCPFLLPREYRRNRLTETRL